MYYIIIFPYLAISYVSTLCDNGTIFRNVVEHEMRFFFILLSTFFRKVYLSKKNPAMFSINNIFIPLKYTLFFSDYNKALIFPHFLEKVSNIKYFDNPILRPIIRCGWKGGRTDGYRGVFKKPGS